tara:strand:+ start:48 stop:287 length:240 start_codon:yes stop_codon:yes gene_type:complete
MHIYYNKLNAVCMWCKRTDNPHPEFDETIPIIAILSKKKRNIELCFYCYEVDLEFCKKENIKLENYIDDKFETLVNINF